MIPGYTLPKAPPQGWVCPKCGRVYGPKWFQCQPCNTKIAKRDGKVTLPPPPGDPQ